MVAGGYIKAVQANNRIEIHRWVEGEFGFDEEYVATPIFPEISVSFVDVRFGPLEQVRPDWYNPVRHYAVFVRDERRDVFGKDLEDRRRNLQLVLESAEIQICWNS